MRGLDMIRHYQHDFKLFWQDGNYVWTRGQINPDGYMDWYLPAVPVAFSLLGALPYERFNDPAGASILDMIYRQAAGVIWWSLNSFLAYWIVRTTGRFLTSLDPRDWTVTQFFPLLVMCPFLWESFRYNQLTLVTLSLLLWGYHSFESARNLRCGFAWGLAALVKIQPAIFVLILLFRRRWTALGAWLLTIVFVNLCASLSAASPSEVVQLHRRWWDRVSCAGHWSVLSGVADPNLLTQSNHSIPAVAARLTSDVLSRPPIPAVAVCVGFLLACGGFVYVWALFRGARHSDHRIARLEFALSCVAMVLLASLQRDYHIFVVYPAVALLLSEREQFIRSGGRGLTILIIIIIWAFLAGLSRFAAVQSYGSNLLGETLLAAGLIVVHRRLRTADGDGNIEQPNNRELL
jgi:hypothetical protein